MSVIQGITHANWRERQQTLSLPGGGQIAYMETGNSSGFPLFLLHGFGNSGRNWKYCFSFLEDYHIFAVDEIGAGQSSCPSQFAFPIIQQAARVLFLMDALGLQEVLLAGHSIGSYIAQAIAFMQPPRVRKLLLISSFARMHASEADIRAAADRYDPAAMQRPDASWYSERAAYPDQEGFRYQLEDLRALPSGYFAPTWWGMMMADHRNFLQFIEAPVLAIWGSRDGVLTASYREELLHCLPHAEERIYEGLGHEIVSQAPEQLCIDMLSFFSD